MKKIFITIAIALACLTATAQVQRNGNTFSAQKAERVKAAAKCDTLDAYWQDGEGKYQIYMGSKGGLFYFKNDKKKYIPKAEATEIKETLGIKQEENKQD